MAFDDTRGTLSGETAMSRTALGKEQLPWSRFRGQMCQVPNMVMHNLPAARKGCFVVRFSNNGK